jgi:hypothetical protein
MKVKFIAAGTVNVVQNINGVMFANDCGLFQN